jgi:hypothetical protein
MFMTAQEKPDKNSSESFLPQIMKGSGTGTIGEVLQRDEADEEAKKNKKKLLCRLCLNEITSEEYGIAVQGAHSHTFMNPRGIVFRIACFLNAQGCFIVGKPTLEYTWFPGYTWSHVICSNCLNHLGWHYQSGGSSFFGLILDQLMER